MEKKLDIICQHKLNGEIIPIKIRLTDEDGEMHTYLVKAYKVIERPCDGCLPNHVKTTMSIWTFECKISVFEKQQIIRIHYNVYQGRWWMDA